jgi:hypothetical protein
MLLRKSIRHQLFFVTICLGAFSLSTTAQNETSLASRIVEALKAKEPNWTYRPFVEWSHEPLVPSEKHILTGTCRGPKSKTQDVQVRVYSVENIGDATAWLKPWRDKQVAEGWKVSAFQIGDEGYLSTYKNGERFEISLRKGTVVARAAAGYLDKVKEFAECVIDSVSPK